MTAALLRHLDLKHLRQLIEISDKGSIRAAADALSITQPALSRSIRAMETEVGLKLVERGPRGAELTAAGQRLLKYARIIEANLKLAENELRGLTSASSQTQQISFGMSWLTEAVVAAPLIQRVMQERPGIRLTTAVGDYEALAPKLMSGKLDFFIGPPPIEGPVVGIATELVTEFPASVIVRAGHPLAEREELSVGDVVGARWILPAAGTVPRITYDNCFLRHGAAAPEPMFEVQPLSPAIRELLLESDLVTILPRVFVRQELAAGLLCALPFDDRIVFPIHLTRRQMSYPSPARDYVIEQICRLFEELGAQE
ncbi:MAG: LysR family transcriptional regulator [Gammaproteobacteria bacterium]|nr:LysR family transcriptional regulator [Gammaproteobacteria bacterium]